MKLEFLVLVTNDDSFCNSKKAFIDFLKIDSLISITGRKLTYKKTPRSNPLITVKFNVETNNIPSNKERYFIIALENINEELIDEFSEVGNKIKELCKRINPESTVINILWDDVGRYYAHKSYPIINDVENVMRKLISKFMLINVGMAWSKETIHPDLVKKIEKFEEDDVHLNDLYKLDFINLSEVLFQKKRDITLDELDRILIKTNFDESDKNKILKYVPKSNWEKYFSTLLGENSQHLEKKWERLYKLRNKVAHNRFLTQKDFGEIRGLSNQVKEILNGAINKLGEIDLDEEDRNQIIYSYQSKNPIAIAYLAEKSVAEFYIRNGFEVDQPSSLGGRSTIDLIVKKESDIIAVEIKSFSSRVLLTSMRTRLFSAIQQLEKFLEQEDIITQGKIIAVVRGDIDEELMPKVIGLLTFIRGTVNSKISINIGTLDFDDNFELIDL
ncbi:HEPN domain-containing protein [Citrobacter portucalensis]|uniref:HEPN domain-containing protein n=4 Tax=Citrobacter portucalensis TaxID=1639133 RepID=UPI00226B6860|nr:HEPN domain-containing protein [Citrobacter portucalensis]MCX9039117.1 HEPN domain-containing protein [Citrobacter portucalensis]